MGKDEARGGDRAFYMTELRRCITQRLASRFACRIYYCCYCFPEPSTRFSCCLVVSTACLCEANVEFVAFYCPIYSFIYICWTILELAQRPVFVVRYFFFSLYRGVIS